MTPLQGCSRRNQWKNKPGILLAIVVIASSSVLISVPSPALAVTSGTAKSSTVFGGYVKGLRRAKERAQANFTVPTVTCDEGSNQALLITQDLNFDRGEYVEAEVVAECNSGTATYSAEAVQCGIDGCNPSMFGPGCAMPEPVSPGDSITLSENQIRSAANPGPFLNSGIIRTAMRPAVLKSKPFPKSLAPWKQGCVRPSMCRISAFLRQLPAFRRIAA